MYDLIENMISFIKHWVCLYFKYISLFLSFDFSVYLAS